MSEYSQKDQRAYRRFHVKEGAFAAVKKSQEAKLIVGQILDISQGGIALKYLDNDEPIDGSHKLDIYFSGRGAQLKDIAFRVISDFRLENSFQYSHVFMRRGCLQFQDMSMNNMSLLNEFMSKYIDSEHQ